MDDLQVRNQFLGKISSNWEKAFKLSKSLPKDHQPIEIIFTIKDKLIIDKSHYFSKKYGRSPTNYMIRISGKGIRRIYSGSEILGYKWSPEINRFVKGIFIEKNEAMYFYIEVDGEKIVIATELSNY